MSGDDQSKQEIMNEQFGQGIRWMSDGPVLELADGTVVRPRLMEPDFTEWMALSTDIHDYKSCYGPEVDNYQVWLWFEEVEERLPRQRDTEDRS